MLDKYDKQIMFEYLWKTINFFYGIMIILSILVGIRTLLYLLGGISEEETSISGTIIVISIIIVYIIFRNLTKPWFMKKNKQILNPMLTEIELNEIEDRINNSTKGNWIPMIEGITHDSGSDFIMTNVENIDDYKNPERGQDIELVGGTKDDIIFIANAKQDIRKLIAEIRKIK